MEMRAHGREYDETIQHARSAAAQTFLQPQTPAQVRVFRIDRIQEENATRVVIQARVAAQSVKWSTIR